MTKAAAMRRNTVSSSPMPGVSRLSSAGCSSRAWLKEGSGVFGQALDLVPGGAFAFFVGAGEEVFGFSGGADFDFEVNAVAVPFDLDAAVPCGDYAWGWRAGIEDFGEYGQCAEYGCLVGAGVWYADV